MATIRASGVRPSSAALVSDMITTAAAPSLSGQQLPAVTTPSGRKTGLQLRDRLEVTPARGPSSAETTVPSGVVTGVISRAQKPSAMRLLGEVLGADAELVELLAGQAAQRGDVLGGLAHRDVGVGQHAVLARVVPVAAEPPSAVLVGPRLGLVEERVLGVGPVVGGALGEARDRLDAGGDEHVALAGLDRVEGHPGGLHRGGAVAGDRWRRARRPCR